ncbi:MAG: hypothetical protein J0H07_25805 [Sphingobacteriales bacterium]|nr:hypothetical protein [Sphingobacteriales bacterium]
MNGKQVISKKSYNKDGVPMSLKEPIKGVFQRWGDEVLYEDERTFGRTIAIVLGEDGIVYTAPPSADKYKPPASTDIGGYIICNIS